MIALTVVMNALAQPIVREVRIDGVHRFSESTVLKQAGLIRGQLLTRSWPDSSLASILRYYQHHGYYQAQIDSFRQRIDNDASQIRIRIWMHEGNTVQVGKYAVSGLSADDSLEILSLLEIRSGGSFSTGLIESDIEQILSFHENHGYPLSEIQIGRFSYNPVQNSVDVRLDVVKGPLVHLDRFIIQGNQLTRPDVIRREIRLKPGNLYRHRAVQNIPEDLLRLGFFDTVDPPVVHFVRDEAIVTIQITEGNPNTLDGVVGYTPSNDPERPGYFTGQLHFLFRNLFGTGRFFEAFWEKKDKYSQAMRFGYEEPWVKGWPFHIGGYFSQEIRDTTYVDRGWRLRMRYAPWTTLSFSVEGGQREILPDSVGSILYDLAQTKSWVGTLGLDYSTFDDPLNPRRGVRYHTAATFGRKKNIGPAFLDTIPQWKKPVNTRHVQIDAEFILPVIHRQIVFAGMHGQEVRSGSSIVPLSEQIRFGGTTTLRGYPEDFFRGSLVVWTNLEYRYLIGRRSRVFVFFDAGMYQRREKVTGLIRGDNIGYGFGIRLETRFGVMGVDYGLGEGDGLMQGKVHVGLVNRF